MTREHRSSADHCAESTAGTPPAAPAEVSEAIDYAVRRLGECLLTVRGHSLVQLATPSVLVVDISVSVGKQRRTARVLVCRDTEHT